MNGKVGPIKLVNHISWVAVVTSTDRSKSVRNRCVIEFFVSFFVSSLCPFDISAGVEAFVIGPSQISYFFSLQNHAITRNLIAGSQLSYMQRVRHANRGRLLLLTPGPVPHWDLHVF